MYQPDREAGYSFRIGVAGVTQTREEVEQVDLRNYTKTTKKKLTDAFATAKPVVALFTMT